MDTAYLHLVTNHIPIIGVPFAIAILLLGIWRNSDDLKSASFLAFAFLGIVSIVVYFTGEPAEEVVEHIAGVAENAIDAHEDVAKFAFASVLVSGALSALGFFLGKGWNLFRRGKEGGGGNHSSWVAPTVLLFSLISMGMLGYTGKLGGMIRHTEFYGGAPAASSDHSGGETGDHDDDDDDRRGRDRKRD